MIATTLNSRVVDLCCGMGGLSVAARAMGMRVFAGVDVKRTFFFAARQPMYHDRILNLLERHKLPPVTPRETFLKLPTPAVRLDTFRVYGSFANHMEQVTNAVPPLLARGALHPTSPRLARRQPRPPLAGCHAGIEQPHGRPTDAPCLGPYHGKL